MYQYEVTLVYGGSTEVFDVDADGHAIESHGDGRTVPPFIVFHRDVPIALDPLTPAHAPDPDNPAKCICGWEIFTAPELAPDKLADHIMDGNAPLAPALQANGEPLLFDVPTAGPVNATTRLEVFRAPLHALLAVKLLDDDEEGDEEEPEVHP